MNHVVGGPPIGSSADAPGDRASARGWLRGTPRARRRGGDPAGGGGVVRVLIVDDHPVVREGLRAMLDEVPGLEIVGEAADGEEAVAQAARTRPDVALMDLRMGPGIDGIEATRRIASLPDAPRVLVFTSYDSEQDIVRAAEAGATGYLLKGTRIDELAAAIVGSARGDTVLAAPVAGRLMSRLRSPTPAPTARELEILGHLADGLTNRGIADRLNLSEATVKSHVAHLFAKLGVDTRAGAVSVAISRGLIDVS